MNKQLVRGVVVEGVLPALRVDLNRLAGVLRRRVDDPARPDGDSGDVDLHRRERPDVRPGDAWVAANFEARVVWSPGVRGQDRRLRVSVKVLPPLAGLDPD